MTCTTCYRVNPGGVTRCYYCGTPLVASTGASAWGGRTADPWAGGGMGPEAGARTDGPTDSAESYSGYTRPHYDTPRTPDLIYNPDGTIALGTPTRLNDRPPRRDGRNRVARLLGPLAPALYLLAKLKFVLFSLAKVKVLLTAATMLVSVATYAWVWGLGWAAAIGFVILLFIHEMGHWTVMRIKGVPASAPIFIPFLGAVIGMRGMPRSVKDEAEIGIAGPIAGTAGALACLGLSAVYGGRLWPWLAMVGLFLNLFNLLPVSPLDGGRIAAAVSRWLWVIGLLGLLGLFVVSHNPFLLLIGFIGGAETIARFRGRYAPTMRPGYYSIGTLERVTMGALYFGLIALIAVTMLTNPLIQGALS